MFRSMVRLIPVLVLLLSCGGCPASSYLSYRASPDYPRDRDETIRIAGLKAAVEIRLDAAGVAHIEASNDADLALAAGFVQGRNRFFQMDMLRRFARGRMAELVGNQRILGGTTVDFDLAMRGWGIDRALKEDVAALDPEGRRLLEAFATGVNAALARSLPLEYRLLRVQPEPWTLADSFAVGRLNAWGVTHNWQQELSRFLLAWSVGLERALTIYPNDWWHGGTSLAPQETPRTLPPAIAPELDGWFPARPYSPSPESSAEATSALLDALRFSAASNSWVVAGDRSASKQPLAANDPHLAHMLPSLFFPQHLVAPGLDVIGVTVPGLPWILCGHNEHVAWGMTSAVGDAVDLYIEKTDPSRPGEVLTSQGWKPLQVEEQIIRVQNDGKIEDRRIPLRRSAHGPILNDMYPKILPPGTPLLALKWAPRAVHASLSALLNAAQARTVEEFRLAVLAMATPATTWTAADTSGAIALFVTGDLPVRPHHLGTFPVPGWSDAYEWADPVDPARLPFAVSRTGVFAHANNLVRPPDRSDVFIAVDAAPSYRFDRIAELLAATPVHTVESLAAIQADVRLNRAKRLLPRILDDLEGGTWTPQEQQALALLKYWDGEAGAGSTAASVFQVFYREAILAALRDEIGPAGLEFLLSQRYSTNVADLWFDRVDHPVWDDRATPETETRTDRLRAAFRRAVAYLATALGPDPAGWRWGRLHRLQIKHAFGARKSLAGFVNLPAAELGGGLDSVWKTHFDLGNESAPFAVVAGPVYRQIVDLADIRHGRWVIDTGVSGWPGSPHYGDLHEAWKKGETVPMVSDRNEIRASAKAVIVLQPGD